MHTETSASEPCMKSPRGEAQKTLAGREFAVLGADLEGAGQLMAFTASQPWRGASGHGWLSV